MATPQRADTEPAGAHGRPDPACPCGELVSATERAALAAGRFLGRGNGRQADEAASDEMALALQELPISGRVVIGRPEQGHRLEAGVRFGGGGLPLDVALDPIEGPAVVARGGVGALSVIAAGDPDSMARVPRMYMKKMAVGPVAKGSVDLRQSVEVNLRAIADAFGRRVADITAIVLDRPRHEDLIAEIREAGARIKVIADGDITATIDAAIRGTNDHIAIGIGGSFQGIISAAALQCLGGEIQAQLWPLSRSEVRQAQECGIADIEQIFGIGDLVKGDMMVVGTGISNGDLLRGVRYFAEGARTHSIVLCGRCNRVRFIDSIHLFSRDRHEEIRL
jgi:fructose-1,6-bisphosphatase II